MGFGVLSRSALAAIVAVGAFFVFSSLASASSIVWAEDDGSIYIADPDGAEAPRQVTADGTPGAPYMFGSQADDGTIVAVIPGPPDRIVVLTPSGEVEQSFLPTQLEGGISSARVSPDATKIAFETFFFGDSFACNPGTSGTTLCEATFVVSITGTDIDAVRWSNPEWISNSRLAVVSPSRLRVGTFDPAPGRVGEPTDWFDYSLDPNFITDEGIGDIAVSSDGSSLATVIVNQTSVVVPDILRLWATAGDPAAGGAPTVGPTPTCNVTNPTGGRFRSPSWSPDGGHLAYEETDGDAATDAGQEGMWILAVPTISDCGTLGIGFAVDDAHHPSWGLAGVAPPDGDGDGVPDTNDNCPALGNAGQANADGDAQGDACDSDDDNDSLPDDADQCPIGASAGADADADGCKDAEDSDDDDDTVPDGTDRCDLLAGAAANGCPDTKRTLTLAYKPASDAFKGKLGPAGPCAGGHKVRVLRKKSGPDKLIGKATTKPTGKYKVPEKDPDAGTYYAKVGAKTIADAGNCLAKKSKPVKLG